MRDKYVKVVTTLSLITIMALQSIWLYNTYHLIKEDIRTKSSFLLENGIEREAVFRMGQNKNRDRTGNIVAGAVGENEIPASAYINEALYEKAGSDVSLFRIDSIYKVLITKADLSSLTIINKVYPPKNIIIESTEEVQTAHWGAIKTKIVPIRLDQSRGVQAILINPYWIIFERMGLLLLATVLMMFFVAGCIIYQIKIIAKQNLIAKIRHDFSHAMIHDMKVPLSSIQMGVDALESGKLDDKPEMKANYFRIVRKETEHLLQLANKVLTISKLEEGKLSLAKQDVFLPDMIENLTEEFALKTTKPIEFSTELTAQAVFADEEYLQEAISNLIDNAIKYSKEAILIEISSSETDRETVIKVKDNGIGISHKDQLLIFEKFERASATGGTRKGGAPGFGLGLNYVMRVIEAHGGKVKVDSIKGEYSEFSIHLPRIIKEL